MCNRNGILRKLIVRFAQQPSSELLLLLKIFAISVNQSVSQLICPTLVLSFEMEPDFITSISGWDWANRSISWTNYEVLGYFI